MDPETRTYNRFSLLQQEDTTKSASIVCLEHYFLQHFKQFVQKTYHRQAQERPRQAHDGLETSRGRLKTGQSRPRQAQDRSKTGQSRLRQAHDRPRQLQDKAHDRPRQAKKGPRRVPDGPTKAKTGSRWAKTGPQSRFGTNFGSSECLKTTVFPMVSPYEHNFIAKAQQHRKMSQHSANMGPT